MSNPTPRFNRDEVYYPEFAPRRTNHDADYLDRVPGWPCPGYRTPERPKIKQGSGLRKRYFSADRFGGHGEPKRGWAPDTWREKEKNNK